MNSIPLYGYTAFCLSIHQLIDIWVVFTFWLLWVILLRTFIHKLLCGHVFSVTLGYIARSGIALSYGSSMFNRLRNCPTVFQSSFPILHSHLKCMSDPVSPAVVIICLFYFSHPSRYEVLSHGFDLHFTNDFSFAFWPNVYLLWVLSVFSWHGGMAISVIYCPIVMWRLVSQKSFALPWHS